MKKILILLFLGGFISAMNVTNVFAQKSGTEFSSCLGNIVSVDAPKDQTIILLVAYDKNVYALKYCTKVHVICFAHPAVPNMPEFELVENNGVAFVRQNTEVEFSFDAKIFSVMTTGSTMRILIVMTEQQVSSLKAHNVLPANLVKNNEYFHLNYAKVF